jgi:hypothetical protein
MKLTDLIKNQKGLGDTIEIATRVTGVKKMVDKMSETLNKDCGCSKRKETLNQKFPYKK